MRCHICDKILEPSEINFSEMLGKFESCFECNSYEETEDEVEDSEEDMNSSEGSCD